MAPDRHLEDLIDAALAETFPASDPPFFVAAPRRVKARKATGSRGRARSAAANEEADTVDN